MIARNLFPSSSTSVSTHRTVSSYFCFHFLFLSFGLRCVVSKNLSLCWTKRRQNSTKEPSSIEQLTISSIPPIFSPCISLVQFLFTYSFRVFFSSLAAWVGLFYQLWRKFLNGWENNHERFILSERYRYELKSQPFCLHGLEKLARHKSRNSKPLTCSYFFAGCLKRFFAFMSN